MLCVVYAALTAGAKRRLGVDCMRLQGARRFRRGRGHTLDGAGGAAVSRGNSRRHGVRQPHTLPIAAWASRAYRSSHRRGRLRSARPSAIGDSRRDLHTGRARPRRRLEPRAHARTVPLDPRLRRMRFACHSGDFNRNPSLTSFDDLYRSFEVLTCQLYGQ
ncbi:hypothetical protein B0H15DRAFT_945352 [Mycena belliarum]|uniref:Uncharacterized protein n=1 Tax=Mycena belliarum TaxID=1033014 RepID=A0AAD6UFT0_9AGAR|nr:hypothetical protein B0H15DRAFT_945352 [Mycena belliae]